MLPVDLIIANTLHKIAANSLAMKPLFEAAGIKEDQILETVARDILANIANSGKLDLVLKAIGAAGGPGDAGEIASRFKAVQDMHTQK